MFEFRNGINIVVLIYVTLFFTLYYYRPKIMFNGDKIKEFGVGKNKTVFNFHVVTLISGLLIFYIYEIVWQRKNNFF